MPVSGPGEHLGPRDGAGTDIAVADGHDGDGAVGADGGNRTPVALPVARLSDPHMQEAARYPRRAEGIIAVILLIGIAGVAAFGGAFWVGASTQVLAATLAIGLFALGFGLTAWGKYLMPQGPFVEERHPLRSSPEEREAMAAAIVDRGGVVVKRRKVLGGLLGAGLGIFGVVAIFPLLRSLGPKPGSTLFRTDWKKGSYLVDATGTRIHRDDLEVGGILTVFPEGKQTTTDAEAVDQTVLIRVQLTDLVTLKGRTDWGPDGYVAYSKVCTHLGCPVGLYEQELELLVCPCHQSMFDVRDGAFPQFGPAPRPLPQLPIMMDSTGFIQARDGYDQPVGPGFWSRTTEGNGKASST
jgi:ubiquinol-cytochrome c reductase iron-sulfur subunit